MADLDWQALLEYTEGRNFDFKAGWEPKNTIGYGRILRAIIGMANSGGGELMFGVVKKGAIAEPIGIPESEQRTYDSTEIRRHLSNHVQPAIPVDILSSPEIAGRRFVLLRVPAFENTEQIPHVVCKQYLPKTEGDPPGNSVLRPGALYIRNENAESVEVTSGEELRRLIDRAVFARQEELLRSFGKILKSRTTELQVKDRSKNFRDWIGTGDEGQIIEGFAIQPTKILNIRPSALTSFLKELPTELGNELWIHDPRIVDGNVNSILGDTKATFFHDGWVWWARKRDDESPDVFTIDWSYALVVAALALAGMLSEQFHEGEPVRFHFTTTEMKGRVLKKLGTIAPVKLLRQLGHISHGNVFHHTLAVSSEPQSIRKAFEEMSAELEAIFKIGSRDEATLRNKARDDLGRLLRRAGLETTTESVGS